MTTTHAQTVKAAMKAAVDAAMSVAEDVVAGRMQPAFHCAEIRLVPVKCNNGSHG